MLKSDFKVFLTRYMIQKFVYFDINTNIFPMQQDEIIIIRLNVWKFDTKYSSVRATAEDVDVLIELATEQNGDFFINTGTKVSSEDNYILCQAEYSGNIMLFLFFEMLPTT